MFIAYQKYFEASVTLIHKAQETPQYTCRKMIEAQKIYLQRNAELYSESEKETITYFLDTFLFKYQLANYSLEQLWAVRHSKVEQNIFDVIKNSITTLELTNDEMLLQSHVFEQFLFQGRACLDFYMLYLVHLLRTKHKGSMSRKVFYKRLEDADPNLKEKAQLIETYFNSKIFGLDNEVDPHSPVNWGTLLKSLRDKIAHKDKINISKNSHDEIMNKILLDFPTIKDLTYDRFCQAMQNGTFNMIEDLFPILYELEWKAGPYEVGMWEN